MSAKELSHFFQFSFYLAPLFAGLGFSGLQIGFLLSLVLPLPRLFPLSGWPLSDRLPARYLSSGSFVLLIICFISLSMLQHFWTMAALLFMARLAITLPTFP